MLSYFFYFVLVTIDSIVGNIGTIGGELGPPTTGGQKCVCVLKYARNSVPLTKELIAPFPKLIACASTVTIAALL